MAFSFVGSSGVVDPELFQSYLEVTTPEVMQSQLSARAANPADARCWGDIAHNLGRNEHAVILYRYALEAFEKNPALITSDTNLAGAYYFLGKTLVQLHRPREAIHPLTTVTTMEPCDAIAWMWLGNANSLMDRLEEALRCYKRALSLEGVDKWQKPAFYQVLRKEVAEIEEEFARQQRARRAVDPRVEQTGGVFDQEMRTAFACFQKNEFANAARHFENAIASGGSGAAATSDTETKDMLAAVSYTNLTLPTKRIV